MSERGGHYDERVYSESMGNGKFCCRTSSCITIREAWVQSSSFLTASGVDDAGHHAELLLRHVLDMEHAVYLAALTDTMPSEVITAWEAAVTRRAVGEPTQYIIGYTSFYGLLFEVTRDVLIPRPETEGLVEAIMAEADRLELQRKALHVADIGTGSGAIACTLAHRRPQWHVYASDISVPALDVARRNAERLGVVEHLSWRLGDLLEPFAGHKLDIIVSNPPYVASTDMANLMREVRDYEPHVALNGGRDGLNLYHRLIKMVRKLTRAPLIIGFEVGQGQAREVATLLANAGYDNRLIIVPDLAGIERHVIGVRNL